MKTQMELEEQVHILELENKALRFQAEKQFEMIEKMQDEVKLLRRFRSLVSRASTMVQDIPDLQQKISSRKNLG